MRSSGGDNEREEEEGENEASLFASVEAERSGMVATATAGDSEMSSSLGKPTSLGCAPLIGDAYMISDQEGVKRRKTIGRIYVISGKGVEEVCIWYKQGKLLIPMGKLDMGILISYFEKKVDSGAGNMGDFGLKKEGILKKRHHKEQTEHQASPGSVVEGQW